eukprot:364303-Chlamydomonas_euryale.AAC.5
MYAQRCTHDEGEKLGRVCVRWRAAGSDAQPRRALGVSISACWCRNVCAFRLQIVPDGGAAHDLHVHLRQNDAAGAAVAQGGVRCTASGDAS